MINCTPQYIVFYYIPYEKIPSLKKTVVLYCLFYIIGNCEYRIQIDKNLQKCFFNNDSIKEILFSNNNESKSVTGFVSCNEIVE